MPVTKQDISRIENLIGAVRNNGNTPDGRLTRYRSTLKQLANWEHKVNVARY